MRTSVVVIRSIKVYASPLLGDQMASYTSVNIVAALFASLNPEPIREWCSAYSTGGMVMEYSLARQNCGEANESPWEANCNLDMLKVNATEYGQALLPTMLADSRYSTARQVFIVYTRSGLREWSETESFGKVEALWRV
jgi:hypothetical protein